MNNFKKTVFLSNKQNSNSKEMAIVTFEKKNSSIFGTIKTFNIDNKNNYLLGIKNNNTILKQNIMLDNNKYNFILSGKLNLEDELGLVLLTNNSNTYTPIIWGSDKISNYKNQILNSLKNTFDKIKSNELVNKKIPQQKTQDKDKIVPFSIDKNEYCYTPYKQSLKENVNENSYSQISLEEEVVPPYHEVATAAAKLFESDDNEINEIINKEIKSEKSFYNMIAEQLEELFNKYPREENLERLIDNSKWVKIVHDDNKSYVVGIIIDNTDIKYICYGVPGNYDKEPPIEMKAYSQWLPTDIRDPYSIGYWVMYQDANTGENVMLE